MYLLHTYIHIYTDTYLHTYRYIRTYIQIHTYIYTYLPHIYTLSTSMLLVNRWLNTLEVEMVNCRFDHWRGSCTFVAPRIALLMPLLLCPFSLPSYRSGWQQL